jgi:hypothetical protein
MIRYVALIIALLSTAPALAQQTPDLTFGADAKSNAPYAPSPTPPIRAG